MTHHQTQKEKACARRKRAWHEQHSKQRLYACRRGVSCVSPRISMEVNLGSEVRKQECHSVL